jgi:hypothetical protein
MNPFSTSVRKRRNSQPSITKTSNDSALLKYSAIGTYLGSDSGGLAVPSQRIYIPGYGNDLFNAVGPSLVGKYSVGKFMPGTKVRWEPSVGATTSGRIFVGFTDNPEVITTLLALTGTTYVSAVRGLGDVVSFPVWQETDITFPTRCRRKMFDTNSTATLDTNIFDRSCQMVMFVAGDALPVSTSTLGNFWYHDAVTVAGLQPVVT